jgi:tetratricopeptide (TPR) repeat protein
LTIDASIQKAILLKAHGLNDDAKRELINLIFDENVKGKDKPRAYYLLGEIAFDENRIQTATKTWGYIVAEYPNSDEALIAKERIDELSKVTLAVYTESLESDDYSIAKLYLKNADFWSEDKDTRWQVDSSWIPKIEFALKWYDKVISEFPKSDAARIAYIGKIRTLLSWRKLDKGTEFEMDDPLLDHLASSVFFSIYIRQLVSTFRDFEKDFPNDITLQACRFQIGQAYFGMGILSNSANDLEQAKKWLEQAK